MSYRFSAYLSESTHRRVEVTGPREAYRKCRRKNCKKLATHRVDADARTRSQNIRMKCVGTYCKDHAAEVAAKLRKGPAA